MILPPLVLLALLVDAPLASSSYDPSSPEARFLGAETWTQDGEIQIWSEIERHSDPERLLFHAEEFSTALEWPEYADWAPWIDDCFGSARPDSSSFLLHVGLHEPQATGTPILLVPGAADNGSRAFVTFAAHMDTLGRPVYALTFAHPHGDLFLQAELVADAVARIRERTGASEIDLLGHSKGAIVASIYASNHVGAEWGDASYQEHGTTYRGDIRKLVLVAPPLGGIDTPYRWPTSNLGSLIAESSCWPSSWQRYYPYGTASLVYDDLGRQDLLPEGGDLFPGQRQLMVAQDHPLPGSLPWLGIFALQQDWWSTWYGGLGYFSWSEGIAAAEAVSGDLLGHLTLNGVDPEIEIHLLTGENPMLPSGGEAMLASWFGDAWVDMATGGVDLWADLLSEIIGNGLGSFGFTESDLQGLASGHFSLGEISGPSDGVVFLDSATKIEVLTARGASVASSATLNLSHLDLLYASPITGELMIEEAERDPLGSGWMLGLGERYVDQDSIGYLERVLADPDSGHETGDTGLDKGDDTDAPAGDSADTGVLEGETPKTEGCACAASAGSSSARGRWGLLSLIALCAVSRRRR